MLVTMVIADWARRQLCQRPQVSQTPLGCHPRQPRGTLPPHDLNAARAPGPPHFPAAHPGPQGLVWRRKSRCGGPQASGEDTAWGGRGPGGGDPGPGYRRAGPSAGLGAPGKGLWAECYGSAHVEPSSLRGQERGPSPLYFLCQDCGSLLCRSHSEPSAELREGPLPAGHLAGGPGLQLSQAGPQACLPCPSTHCLQIGEMAPDIPDTEGGLDCFQSCSHVQHQLWGIPRDSLTLFSPCWGHRIPGRMRPSLRPLGPSVSRDRVITSFPKVGRP